MNTLIDYTPNCELPHENVTQEIIERFESYRNNPQLLELIARLAEEREITIPDPTDDENSFMAASGAAFDFRKGKKREELNGGDLSQEVKDLAEALVDQFDMKRNTEPVNPDFDAVLILGGAGITPLTRLNYAMELQEQDRLRAPTIVMVGGERPVNDAEIGRAGEVGFDQSGKPAETEFDLMRNTAAKKLNIDDDDWEYYEGDDQTVPHEQGFHTTWRMARTEKEGQEVLVLSAPMLDEDRYQPNGIPRNRANTVDSLLMAAKFMGMGRIDGGRFALVTNAVFVPFQDADGKKALTGYGVETETIGMTREHSGLAEWQNGDIGYYIQETLSALRSTRAARDKLTSITHN